MKKAQNPKEQPTLLLIDDDIKLTELLRADLEAAGYVVAQSAKISDALWKLRNQKFDAVLLDLNLGHGVSGEDILTQIRSNKAETNYLTPVIVISGFLSKELVARLGPFSNVTALVKPFRTEGLIERIKAQLAGGSPKKTDPAVGPKTASPEANPDEQKFLHDLSSPLGAAMILVETLIDKNPDLGQLEELKKSLTAVGDLLRARKEAVEK